MSEATPTGGAEGAAARPAPPATLAAQDVVWEGRPVAGLARGDALAGAAAFALTTLVLGGGLAAAFGAPPRQALQLGLAYGALVGALTTAGRAAGATTVTLLLLAFFAPLAVAAAVTGQEGLALLCPASTSLVLVGLVAVRFRQRRATRYLVTAAAAAVDAGDVGRYRVVFRVTDLPVVVRDRFGGAVGDVDFGPREATLTTRDGSTFRMPVRPRRFHRVREPERLVEALRAARG